MAAGQATIKMTHEIYIEKLCGDSEEHTLELQEQHWIIAEADESISKWYTLYRPGRDVHI